MTISHAGSTSTSACTSASVHTVTSVSISAGTDRYLIMRFSDEDGGASSITATSCILDPGGADETALTFGEEVSVVSGAENYTCIFYLLDGSFPPAGSYSVQFGLSGSISVRHGSASQYDGCAQQAPEATGTGTASSSTSVTSNITTVTNNAWVIDSLSTGATDAMTPGGSQTSRDNTTFCTTATGAGSDLAVATAGSTSTSWSAGASVNRLALVNVALKEASTTSIPVMMNHYRNQGMA